MKGYFHRRKWSAFDCIQVVWKELFFFRQLKFLFCFKMEHLVNDDYLQKAEHVCQSVASMRMERTNFLTIGFFRAKDLQQWWWTSVNYAPVVGILHIAPYLCLLAQRNQGIEVLWLCSVHWNWSMEFSLVRPLFPTVAADIMVLKHTCARSMEGSGADTLWVPLWSSLLQLISFFFLYEEGGEMLWW